MIQRTYETALAEYLRQNRQMAFLSGPRQVGKTTSVRACAPDARYFNWDHQPDRMLITAGADAVAREMDLEALTATLPVGIFDEVHQYSRWKSFLKGLFDLYGDRCRIMVTGSSRLDVYKRGGDSLMGRYFLYRMHPLSVAEFVSADLPDSAVRPPVALARDLREELRDLTRVQEVGQVQVLAELLQHQVGQLLS